MKRLNNKKGLSLIILIITIIVILILSTVILLTLSKNNIIKSAKDAKFKEEEYNELQKLNVAVLETLRNSNSGNITTTLIREKLSNAFDINEYILTENKNNTWSVELKNNTYIIDESGKIKLACDRTGLNIGEFVDYSSSGETFNLKSNVSGSESDQIISKEELKWKILNICKNGNIDLICEYPTNATIKLQGARGYNNGVYALNKTCNKLYSNLKINSYAQNLSLDYIEDLMSEEGILARNNTHHEIKINGETSTLYYGQTYTYNNPPALYYPAIYEYEMGSGINSNKVTNENGIKKSEDYYTEESIISESGITSKRAARATFNDDGTYINGGLTMTQTRYYMDFKSSYFKNVEQFNAIFCNGRYWLSSRQVHIDTITYGYPWFGISSITNKSYNGTHFLTTYHPNRGYSNALRPIVTITGDIEIEKNEDYDGVNNIHKIKYND